MDAAVVFASHQKAFEQGEYEFSTQPDTLELLTAAAVVCGTILAARVRNSPPQPQPEKWHWMAGMEMLET